MGQPEDKFELVMRGDMGIKWSAGLGQFEEPVPPVKPTELDGVKLPVHLYLDPQKIGPNDALAPAENSDNNQKAIKKIKKKKIKWYVKVPGGGGDHPHDDYSYHSYPWDGHGSSSSSMSPDMSSSPDEDTSGGGYPLPPGFGTNPGGVLFNGESAATAVTNAPTQQVQFGGAPPNSPALSQRFNIFPFRTSLIPTAFRTFRKLKGITDLEVILWVKPSDAIPGGESVEMNITLIPMESLNPPTHVWRKAFIVDDTWPGGASGAWTKKVIKFNGFDAAEEYPVTFNIARRSDVSPNYSDTEIWVMYTLLSGVR